MGSLFPKGPAGWASHCAKSLPAWFFQSQPLDCLKRTQAVSLQSLFFSPGSGGGLDLIQEFPWRAETSSSTPCQPPSPTWRGSPPAPSAPASGMTHLWLQLVWVPQPFPTTTAGRPHLWHSPALVLGAASFQPIHKCPPWFGSSCSSLPPQHILFPSEQQQRRKRLCLS